MEAATKTNVPNQDLQQLLSTGLLTGTEDTLQKAFNFASNFYQEEKKQGSITDQLEIAMILVTELNLSAEPVLAILLRDLNKQEILSKKIETDFGKPVLELIRGLDRIDQLETAKYTSNTENFIKLLLTISEDIRVILISLGLQLYKMRHIRNYSPEDQQQITGEISLLYIPLAHRIGLYRVKTELEDLVMRFMEPVIYEQIEQKIKDTQEDRNRYTAEFIRPISERLKENGFVCEIKSRVKSIPSIRKKIQVQKVEFEKVYDLFAIRIIIENSLENEKSDCWKVYSLVTDIYTPNPRRLRDWISFPKTSGYESLHTTVIGPEGKWVEVQIRTLRMDEIAEKSFAAHWKYKTEGKGGDQTDFYSTIRDLLEKPGETAPEKTVSREKRELYRDEIFIFTPKGDLKKLKSGYTVLDFAFEVHTDVGATCTGAIVNGVMVPLKHVLKNGDTVKILTSKNQKPGHDWLEFVKSPRVQARIRHALKMESYKESDAGKEIIKNKVTQLGLEFTDVILNKLVDFFDCENYLDLYQRFGEGKLDPLRIKKALTEPEQKAQTGTPAKEESFPVKMSEVMSGKRDYIVIDKKLDSIHYQFARCCNPIPGDNIFAFVSITQGIKIHKTNCPNAHQLITRYPYRILEARWKVVETDKTFTANLNITGNFSRDIVSRLNQFITNELKVNVRSSKIKQLPDNSYSCEMGILVNSKVHLDDIMKRLLKLKEVSSVTRTSGD